MGLTLILALIDVVLALGLGVVVGRRRGAIMGLAMSLAVFGGRGCGLYWAGHLDLGDVMPGPSSPGKRVSHHSESDNGRWTDRSANRLVT